MYIKVVIVAVGVARSAKPLYVCAIYPGLAVDLYITSLVEFRIKKYG